MKRLMAVMLVISVIANILLGLYHVNNKDETAEFINKYPLLSKRLAAEDHNDILIDFDPLRQQVKDYLAKINIPHSFYFEYLPTGTNIRDGDSNELVGASLMKTPIVMNLYKAAEAGKIDLNKKVMVQKSDISSDPLYGSPGKLKAGDMLTLREISRIALTESDNTAAYIVFRTSKDLIPLKDQSLNNLDIEVQTRKTEEGGEYVLIGARAYASILKCLYLSCYLSEDSSSEILDSLTASTTTKRIKAGVPDNIKVASKIGSFSQQTQSDCGIVYLPKRPYLLCIMLQSNKDVETYFKEISRIAYEYTKEAN